MTRSVLSAALAVVWTVFAAAGPPEASRTDGAIGLYQSRIRSEPGDFYNYEKLSESFVEKARETGDTSYYDRADALLTKALTLEPDCYECLVTSSAVSLARHDFEGSASRARRAVALLPERPEGHAALGDALLNLGEVEAAADSYQTLRRLRPGFAADVRLAQLEELSGDVAAAVRRLEGAIEDDLRRHGPSETTAWAQRLEAEMQLGAGKVEKAETLLRSALESSRNRAPILAALARAEAARGNDAEAVCLMEKVVEAAPLPAYVAFLGDVRSKLGQEAEARRLYGLAEKIGWASAAAFARDVALIRADHGDAEEAVRLAVAELAVRHDVFTWDALAWALHAAGRKADAVEASHEALRLGTRDARLVYHAGVILMDAGEEERGLKLIARALEINPAFDVLKAADAWRSVQHHAHHAEERTGAGDSEHLSKGRTELDAGRR